ncbi:hypothetical protein [Leeuwenhoekiella nanhaiensis]|uniref:Uncharacterized protein n=1 Tax=Leeuwenhoekiella nanhaiensis TaxID=1655491 RepID=A0A2G1VMP5_9FLAO|nr:hypothetical protein [Leeuwenhoekiella nanhaiensis]PHQ27870.1 hypothetical protein CJ305_17855 [Leeuwenhoekiella nanhaiensis]
MLLPLFAKAIGFDKSLDELEDAIKQHRINPTQETREKIAGYAALVTVANDIEGKSYDDIAEISKDMDSAKSFLSRLKSN